MIKLCLAAGTGLGVYSCFYFIWLWLFGPSNKGLLATMIGIVVLMTAVFAYRAKKSDRPVSVAVSDARPRKRSLQRVLAIVFIVSVVFGVASFIFISLKRPHGDWDAWAIWNLRARFLFKAGDQWTTAFSSLLEKSRPDYPLLVPAAIAGFWTSIGDDTVMAPVVLSFLFTFASVGLAVSALTILRGKSQAFLAGVILLGTPFLIVHGASQYADVPVAFFFLATLVFLALQDRLPEGSYNFLTLAGLTAGLAAWTKNEGIIFVAAIAVARLITVARQNGLKCYLRQMLSFVAGLAPILVLVIWFKTQLAPANYLTSQGSQTTLQKLMDASRHLQVWNAFAKESGEFGGWAVSIPLLLIFYLLLSGLSIKQKEKVSTFAALITLCFVIIAYSFVFVVTPFDIAWQLSTSLNRLFLQLWPSFIFVYFLMARPVEQAVMKEQSALAADSGANGAAG